MKKVLLNLFVALMSISLVACSTNTQKENTAIGAVGGAVVGGLAGSLVGGGTGQVIAIGAGAIIGALVGGTIGHSMDSSDQSKTYYTLDHNGKNRSTTWTNTKNGTTYTVTPVSKRFTVNGNHNCRKFRTSAMVDGKTENMYGVACRQADGSWKSVNVR